MAPRTVSKSLAETLCDTGRLLLAAGNAWVDDRASSMGAALAYYTLFSLAPLLLIAVSVAGLVFGEEAARGELYDQLVGLVGPASAVTVQEMLESLNVPQKGVVGTLIGLVVMAVGATTVFAELRSAIDHIWRAPVAAPSGGLFSWLRVRLLSLGLVLGIGFLLMVSLVVSAALSAFSHWATPWFGHDVLLAASTFNVIVSLLFVMGLFAMLYKWLPHVHLAWRDVWIGAGAAAILFTAGKWLIGLYIGRSGVTSVFGAAASLVVLMLWVYFSAQIFLFGAEITSVYAHRHGSLRGQRPM
ncbi:MAG: YihY/virulence factor BrkB family protein [Burkholderiales bacterium]